jgi:hypothetical protein
VSQPFLVSDLVSVSPSFSTCLASAACSFSALVSDACSFSLAAFSLTLQMPTCGKKNQEPQT